MRPQVKIALFLPAVGICLGLIVAFIAEKRGPDGGVGEAALPPASSTTTLPALKQEALQPSPRNELTLDPAQVAAGSGKLIISLKLPQGYKVNDEAPTKVVVRLDGTVLRFDGKSGEDRKRGQAAFPSLEKMPDPLSVGQFAKPAFPLEVPIEIAPGDATATADLWVYYCREGEESACFFKDMRLQLPVHAEAGGKEHDLNIVLEVKR